MRIRYWSSDVCSSDLKNHDTLPLNSVRVSLSSPFDSELSTIDDHSPVVCSTRVSASWRKWRKPPVKCRLSVACQVSSPKAEVSLYFSSCRSSTSTPLLPAPAKRSEERRVGNEGVSTCNCRRATYPSTKNTSI